MYHYPFHLRDYIAKTKHLSPIEDLCYRRLLDAYYTREGALPRSVDECARLICLRDHVKEIELVLLEFFELTENGFFNERCEQELERYRARGAKAKTAATARWTAPTEKPKRSPAATTLFPDADPQVVSDFVSYRARVKAPITPTAVKGIYREAAKAELSINEALTMCVERSWRGFRASWVEKEEKKSNGFDLEAEMRRAT
jgi:uncharacterized protein YdaU (DUF1376 family)